MAGLDIGKIGGAISRGIMDERAIRGGRDPFAERAKTKEDKDKKLKMEMAQGAAIDGLNLLTTLQRGDYEAATEMNISRLKAIMGKGRNPEDTIRIQEMLDAEDWDGVMGEMGNMVQGFALKVPEYGQNEEVQEALKTLRGGGSEEDQKQINALRKDIMAVSKDFRQVNAAFKRIEKGGRKGTAASDISLIFNFMKINDPGSTVREGEFATAQNAAGVPERAINLYNSLLKGTRLSPEQRNDFLSSAKDLVDGQREATDIQFENILQQADQDGISRKRVMGEKRYLDYSERRDKYASDRAKGRAPTPVQNLTDEELQEQLRLVSGG